MGWRVTTLALLAAFSIATPLRAEAGNAGEGEEAVRLEQPDEEQPPASATDPAESARTTDLDFRTRKPESDPWLREVEIDRRKREGR